MQAPALVKTRRIKSSCARLKVPPDAKRSWAHQTSFCCSSQPFKGPERFSLREALLIRARIAPNRAEECERKAIVWGGGGEGVTGIPARARGATKHHVSALQGRGQIEFLRPHAVTRLM